MSISSAAGGVAIGNDLPVTQAPAVIAERETTSDGAAWDQFARLCDASFRSSHRASRAWQLEHHLAHRMHRFTLWLPRGNTRVKIGQAAIGFGPRLGVFADGLQLLPEYSALWSSAMEALLQVAGPGRYYYGSKWSLEPARDQQCAAIAGVTMDVVRPIAMYSVDFSQWPTWQDYVRAISENARRNARKAARLGHEVTVDIRRGTAMLGHARQLLRLRRGLFLRKGLPFSTPGNAARLALRAWAMQDDAFIAVAHIEGMPISGFGGITFGKHTYFIDSGSQTDDKGAYWFLMLRMLEDAYLRAPQGRFVTGAYYEGSPVTPGLDFFRHQCRAQPMPTSEFAFTFAQP